MTPGKGVGKTVDAKKSLSWCYQRDRWQTWHAQMCDDKDFTAINVINTDLEPVTRFDFCFKRRREFFNVR